MNPETGKEIVKVNFGKLGMQDVYTHYTDRNAYRCIIGETVFDINGDILFYLNEHGNTRDQYRPLLITS